MPEIAEVKIMSDFINAIQTYDSFYEHAEKSEVSKVKTDLNLFDGGVYTVTAKSRGKELMLEMEMLGGESNGPIVKKLLCTMGMSGNWVYVKDGSPKMEKAMKHGHLRIKSTRNNWLILYDPRRFAKWKFVDSWSKNRGYCPLTEFENFSADIINNCNVKKDFSKPVYEVMMNQKWFNGIGNYLRAEILYRLDVNPFQPFNQLLNDDVDYLLILTHICCKDAYELGGGQLKDWFNPEGASANSFKEWMVCYGNKNMSTLKDSNGRVFWYHPKWDEIRTNTMNTDI